MDRLIWVFFIVFIAVVIAEVARCEEVASQGPFDCSQAYDEAACKDAERAASEGASAYVVACIMDGADWYECEADEQQLLDSVQTSQVRCEQVCSPYGCKTYCY